MEFNYKKEERLLLIKLTQEIDHHVAERIRRKADYEIQRYMPKKVVFDFSEVNFMDSAGIGLIIGRYKMTSMLGGILEIRNVSPAVKRILEMAGILKIISIIDNEENMNEKCV